MKKLIQVVHKAFKIITQVILLTLALFVFIIIDVRQHPAVFYGGVVVLIAYLTIVYKYNK